MCESKNAQEKGASAWTAQRPSKYQWQAPSGRRAGTSVGPGLSERARPFADLLSQVRRDDAGFIADLGCGTGSLTRTLAERWPAARVVGVDNSAAMLEQARPLSSPGRLEFVEADIADWSPDRPVD